MLALCSLLSLPPAYSTAGLVELLHDNFDDASLNPAKWTTNTAIPRGPARVEQVNNRIEFDNRGHLVTQAQYEPAAYGGLLISGRWTFLSPPDPNHDILAVLTRSDGVPTGTFSETANGIEFQANQAGELRIVERVAGVPNQIASAPISIDPGDTFWFSIFDDGTQVSFSLTELNGTGSHAQVSALTSLSFADNHVAFHNREGTEGFHTAYLDEVSIEAAHQVPEPTTGVLALLATAFVIVTRINGRRAARQVASSSSCEIAH